MSEQKALLLEHEFGDFIVGNRPIPQPGPGELLVKVQAAGLNPVDWKIQKTGAFIKAYPAVLGSDVAGDIEELGEGVNAEKWPKGTRVFFQGWYDPDRAAFQQYALTPADLVCRIPPNLSYSDAASIPVAFNCAAYGLLSPPPTGSGLNPSLDKDVKYTEQSALVIGGNTSVGQYAIQILSKVLHFATIVAYASNSQSSALESLGATHIIDRYQISLTELPNAFLEITSNTRPSIVFDAFGAPEGQEAGYALLAEDGTLCTVNPEKVENKVEGKRAFAVIGSVHLPTHRDFGVKLMEELERLVSEGIIVPNRVQDLPNGLAGIVDGLERLKDNKTDGCKLIAHPQD
ncbi:GroES-likeprotein [Moniliophthora roreri MCA 2997]|uniref:GroES-likeprotein n=2 Tax=Moniliophthora roreri TaxID=221103 RepID=V2WUE9_MONRO|nr:GroES-likeprotein [Moniliophthora roreri MCA 2997]KAI3615921.1 GroES-likeprotein [Moniliophthora roreri]